jgi:membrane fusion protein (multidrug efflux system)
VKRKLWGGVGAALVTGILAVGYLRVSSSEQPNSGDEGATVSTKSSPELTAPVKVTPIRQGTVTEEITVYGTVVPAAGAVQTVSVPFESRVRRVLVTEAQRISQGDALLEIEPSAEAKLQADLARRDFESAQKAFDFMQQRFDL